MILWTGLEIGTGALGLAVVVGCVREYRRERRTERPVSPERKRIDCEARKLLAPRDHLPHHCAGTDTCCQCAEMREAHRREELGIHFAGASRTHTASPTGTGDTTRRGW